MKRALLVSLILLTVTFRVFAIQQNTFDQKVTELSQQISKEMSENQKKTIAVVEFSDLRGNVTDFGRFLSEELITHLYQVKKFKVIERQMLNKVIGEQKLSLTGVVDPNAAKQLGKLLSVDAIASGSITDLAQSLRINARLISTETGEIFAVASTEIFKDESVIRLLGSGQTNVGVSAKELSSVPPTVKQPAPVKKSYTFINKQIRLTINSLKKSRDTMTAIVTYESLEEKDVGIGAYGNDMYLLDENGTRWSYESDPVGFTSHVILVPNTKLTIKFIFKTQGSNEGRLFTFITHLDAREGVAGRIVINDIPAD